MFLKALAVSSSVFGTVLLTQYHGIAKENHPDYPPRVFPTTLWDDNWDLMKPDYESMSNLTDEEKEAKIPKAVRNVYLVRHGQYEIEETEAEKRVLTPLGREQAERTGQRLHNLLGDSVSHVYISTYVRAMETGHIILKHLNQDVPVDYSELAREGAPVPPEPEAESWNPEPWMFHRDGARIEAAFRHFIHRAHPEQSEDSHEIVVCHGNVIRYFVCRALQNDPAGWLRYGAANASITHLAIRPNGNVSLKGFGEKGHLSSEMITYN